MMGKMAKAAVFSLFVLLLTGCWSRRELTELSIAVGLGLDVAPNNQYTVSVQLVNPGQIASRKSGPVGTPVSTFEVEARSVFEALRKLTTKVNRQIYMSHLRILVIGEELARKGIAGPIDFLSRDHEVRTDFLIAIAKDGRADDVLSILTPQEKIPASHLYTSLDISEKVWAETGKITLDKLIDDLTTEGKSPAITGLMVQGPPTQGAKVDNIRETAVQTLFQYNGMAVFKGDKLTGWLNEIQSKGYQFTQGNVKSTVILNPCQGGEMEVELIHSSTKLKAKVIKGEPEVDITIRAEGNLGDITCNVDLTDPSSIPLIERATEQAIRDSIQDSVRTVQNRYRSDIFGFGEAVHRASPRRWKQWKSEWAAVFPHVTVNTKVYVDIRRIGTIKHPIGSRIRM